MSSSAPARRALVAPLVAPLVALLTPLATTSAQRLAALPAHLRALAVPPASVGTCLPAPPQRGVQSVGAPLEGRRLVMTSRTPAARREITVYATPQGRVTSYAERSSATAASLEANDGVTVLASLDPSGAMRGMRITSAVRLPAGTAARRDPAALRAATARATSTTERAELDAATQAQVRTLAAWMLRRCPAK